MIVLIPRPPPREVNLKRLQACRDVEARIAYQPWPDPASDPILYLRRQNCTKIICATKIAPDVAKFTGLARNLGFARARGRSCDLVIVFKTGRGELNEMQMKRLFFNDALEQSPSDYEILFVFEDQRGESAIHWWWLHICHVTGYQPTNRVSSVTGSTNQQGTH